MPDPVKPDDSSKGGDDAMTKALTKFEAQFGALGSAMKILAEGMTKMEQKVNELQMAPSPKGGGRGDSSDVDLQGAADDVDLETLSNKDLAAHLSGRILRSIEDGPLKKMMETMEKLEGGLGQVAGHIVTKEVAGKHKDFDKWNTEIDEERKRNPNLAIEDAYLLAKSRHPDKVETLAKEVKDAEAAASPRRGFGGLTPTSSTGASDGRKMTSSDAGEAAWSEVAAAFGDVLQGNSTQT